LIDSLETSVVSFAPEVSKVRDVRVLSASFSAPSPPFRLFWAAGAGVV